MTARRFLLALVVAIAAAAVPARAAERVVNFYNWSDYVAPMVFDAFTRETGITVRYDAFDGNDTLEAKLFAGQVVKQVTSECLEILGGAGFVEDHPIEQWYRDAPIFATFEGTAEIQKLLIASAEAGLRIR